MKKTLFVCLIVLILSGCTSATETNRLKQEVLNYADQLSLAQEELNRAKEQYRVLKQKMADITERKSDERDTEMRAISYVNKTKVYFLNNGFGVTLPLLYGLIFAEHTTPLFGYLKQDTINKTDAKLNKYLSDADGSNVDNFGGLLH